VTDPDPAESTIAERMAAGSCLRCGGAGHVHIPEVRRGSLLIRRARRIGCPDCGGPARRVQVVEHPRESWAEAQRLAGDVDPDGRRITGRPDAS
jgi:hypothetical protein